MIPLIVGGAIVVAGLVVGLVVDWPDIWARMDPNNAAARVSTAEIGWKRNLQPWRTAPEKSPFSRVGSDNSQGLAQDLKDGFTNWFDRLVHGAKDDTQQAAATQPPAGRPAAASSTGQPLPPAVPARAAPNSGQPNLMQSLIQRGYTQDEALKAIQVVNELREEGSFEDLNTKEEKLDVLTEALVRRGVVPREKGKEFGALPDRIITPYLGVEKAKAELVGTIAEAMSKSNMKELMGRIQDGSASAMDWRMLKEVEKISADGEVSRQTAGKTARQNAILDHYTGTSVSQLRSDLSGSVRTGLFNPSAF